MNVLLVRKNGQYLRDEQSGHCGPYLFDNQQYSRGGEEAATEFLPPDRAMVFVVGAAMQKICQPLERERPHRLRKTHLIPKPASQRDSSSSALDAQRSTSTMRFHQRCPLC